MLKRIITAIVALAILTPVLIFSDTMIFPIMCTILCGVGIFELLGCVEIRKHLPISIPSILVFSSVIPLVYFLDDKDFLLKIVVSELIILIFWIFAYTMFSKGKIKFSNVCEVIAFSIYVLAGFLTLVLNRNLEFGKYYYIFVFVGAWTTDTFAYFAGFLFGKHKLIPEVSPKKTVEGAIGGVIGCVLSFVLTAFICSKVGNISVNYIAVIIVGIITSVISQIGDLIASYVKREHNIKDYGFLFPGHGGVLDRFDSTILVSQFLFIITFVPFLTFFN